MFGHIPYKRCTLAVQFCKAGVRLLCLHSTAEILFYLTGIHSVNRQYTPNGYLRHHIRPCIFAGRHHCQTKKMNSMRTLTTHRLLDCFREAVQERNTVSENILSSAYDEFL